MGFDAYFLIVWDFINWGKSQGIVFGPGRGSAAGSIIAYSLRITELDPMEFDLLFERFLNPDRISMPDIDIDFEYTKREEIKIVDAEAELDVNLPEARLIFVKPKGLYYKRTEEQYITKATIIFLFTLSELKRKRVPQKSLKQC
jgi:hypothetical protein